MNDYWVKQLATWRDNGTEDRLELAKKDRTTVRIPRSDGSVSEGIIQALGGFGGRVVNVTIIGTPELYKVIDTEAFLELNPNFGPSLIELVPDHKLAELKKNAPGVFRDREGT